MEYNTNYHAVSDHLEITLEDIMQINEPTPLKTPKKKK